MKRIVVALCALMALAGGACGTLLSPAAAVVNGHKITIGEVEDALARFEGTTFFKNETQKREPDTVRRLFEQNYLSQLIRHAVLGPAARAMGVTVSDEEVNAEIEDFKTKFPSEEQRAQLLSEQGLLPDQVPDVVRYGLLEQKIKAKVIAPVKPTDAELHSFYEAHADEYVETRASMILVDDKTLADQLADQLHHLPKDQVKKSFAGLAKQHSTDKNSAARGGDLGYFTAVDVPPEFANAAEKLDVGEVSHPIQTTSGYILVEVTDRRPQPFADVKDAILELIGSPAEDAAWQSWLLDAYQAADVKVNPRFGEFDPITQQIVNASSAQVPGIYNGPSPSASPLPNLIPSPSSP